MTREGYLQNRNMALMSQSRRGKDITGAYNFIRRAMYTTAKEALQAVLDGFEEAHHAGAKEEYEDFVAEGYE